MSTAGRDASPATAASDVAAACRDAGFVRLVGRADGDALAALGVLANALDATGTPFQAAIADPFGRSDRQTDADCTVALGADHATADVRLDDEPSLAATAFEAAADLDASPDPVLALAGTVAADAVDPSTAEAATAAGAERRPGLAVPVDDLVDGLAHTTLLHAPWSGDVDAIESMLADVLDDAMEASTLDTDAHRRVASRVSLETVTAPHATARAATAIERALRPHVAGPLATVGGYADVLDAVARERPGIGVSLALGHEHARDRALDAWRTHASRAHQALTTGETQRHDGCFVVRAGSMPVGTVARLAADFRSPEPLTLAVADRRAAAHATGDRDAGSLLTAAADAVGGEATGTGATARARYADAEDFLDAVREAR